MRQDLKLSHKGLILVSVPLLFEVVFMIILAVILQQSEREVYREIRARTIMSYVERINTSLSDAGEAATGYSMSQSSRFLQKYQDAVKPIPDDIKALSLLTRDNRAQWLVVNQCKHAIDRLIANLTAGVKAIDEGKQLEGLGQLEEWKIQQREFRSKAEEIVNEQEKIVKQSPAARARVRADVVDLLTDGLAFNIILALSLAWYFHKGVIDRLNVLLENTSKLVKNESLNPPLEGNDEIAHLDGVFHEMADNLSEAARKERALIDNAQDVICSLDSDGNFTKMSPASSKLWGYKPEELIGTKFTDLIVEEDAGKGLHEARKSLHGAPIENRVKRKDGELVYMLWSAFWSPTERSMFCVAHDITQRKRAEEEVRASEARIHQIIDSMPVGLFIIDEKGLIEMTNPTALELFRYGPDEITGKNLRLLFNDQKTSEPVEFMKELQENAMGHITEREALRKDGTTFPMELSLKAYLAREGKRYLSIMLDVTERHEIDRLKQEFFAMVSHDLRSPLTSIQAFLMMLGEGIYGDLSPNGLDKASEVDRSATRLLALVNDLLDLDKLESGRFEMEFNNIPISSVVDRSLDAVRTIAEQRGVNILAPKSEEQVYADGDRLVQVLVNLLGNAIKYSPPGEPVVISINRLADSVEVRVTDKGRGVPEHLKSAIFERFKQVDVRDRKEKGGSGLGLAISKTLIEQQGGTIGVDSETGKGSSFWITIPVATNPA